MTEIWRLEDPAWLLLLLLLPLIYRASLRPRAAALPYPTLALAEARRLTVPAYGRHLPALLRCLGFVLLVWAMARPQGGTRHIQRESDGVDIMVAADTSQSMEAMDFTVGGEQANRLEAAARVFKDFIERREGDRIGIVAFGETAFTQAPLTTDTGALSDAVRAWHVGMAGGRKTAIGDAIAVASKRLKDLEAESKVIILLTDGENTGGELDPFEAAEAAKALGIRIYTIGIGSNRRAPFPVRDPRTGSIRLQMKRVSFDEEGLRRIAEITDAAYFNAVDTDSLEQVVRTIDALETTEVEVREIERYHERFRNPLLAGLLLWGLAWGIGAGRTEAWP